MRALRGVHAAPSLCSGQGAITLIRPIVNGRSAAPRFGLHAVLPCAPMAISR